MKSSPQAEKQRQTVRQYFEAQAPQWDEPSPWNGYYKSKLVSLFRTLTPIDGSVLEVGCATGELLAKLNPSTGVGVDFAEPMVALAQKKFPKYSFKVQDVESLSLGRTFDVVILSDLLDSLIDVWQAVRSLQSVCAPATRVILTHHNHLWSPLVKLAEWLGMKTKQPVHNWLSPSVTAEVLALNGFEIVRKGNFILFPIKIPLISDFLNRYIAPLPIINAFCFSRYIIARYNPSVAKPPLSISVIVPCLNEAGNVAPLIERLPDMGARMEIIFVDGGSKDGTTEAIESQIKFYAGRKDIKLIHQSGLKGKVGAVRQGFAAATCDVLMILDADISTAPEDMPKFLLALQDGRAEMANGARLVYSMEDGAMQSANFMANHFFSWVFSWLLSQPLQDTLCGTKVMFKKHYEHLAAARAYFGDFDPFGDFDLLFGSARLNLKIVNIPVRYEARRYGTTKIHRWSHGVILLRMVWYAMWKLKFV